jgi:hypothetical protein
MAPRLVMTSFRAEAEELERLSERATRQGLSRSELIRRVIRKAAEPAGPQIHSRGELPIYPRSIGPPSVKPIEPPGGKAIWEP